MRRTAMRQPRCKNAVRWRCPSFGRKAPCRSPHAPNRCRRWIGSASARASDRFSMEPGSTKRTGWSRKYSDGPSVAVAMIGSPSCIASKNGKPAPIPRVTAIRRDRDCAGTPAHCCNGRADGRGCRSWRAFPAQGAAVHRLRSPRQRLRAQPRKGRYQNVVSLAGMKATRPHRRA